MDIIQPPVGHPPVASKHRNVFNGVRLSYTATVDGITVETAPGEAARIVSFAYTRDGADLKKRPVLFLFNGGPIVTSQYLHLGAFGPRRVAFPDDVTADPSTFRLVHNAYSPIDATDLVFVDPASTGFSRVLPGTDPSRYFSVKNDARQMAAFIRAWVRRNRREGAPIYLFGESYGTNRAAEIARQLAEAPEPMPLAGVFLYGQAANIIEYAQRPTNIVSYVASLPTLAATAWYHKKANRTGRSLAVFLAEASAFAKTDYLLSLYKGNALPEPDRRRVADTLAAFTGIPAAWYLNNGLKITKEQYRRELFRDEARLLGRADSRYGAPYTEDDAATDPSDVIPNAIEAFFPRYLREDLKLNWNVPYVPSLAIMGFNDWDWGDAKSPFGDWPYHTGITRMMDYNPAFRLFVGNGIYDMQTTMGAAELLTTQSGWDPARVTLRFYDGGHMGYSVDAVAHTLSDDLRAFVTGKTSSLIAQSSAYGDSK